MNVEAYRAHFFEFITEIFEEFTSIIIKTDDGINDMILIPVEPSYIPTEYTILVRFSDTIENTIIYMNEDGMELSFSQRLITQSETIKDTENTVVEILNIGNQTISALEIKG